MVIALGCERNQLTGFMREQGFEPGPRFHTFVMQETGGTRKTIEAGIRAVEEMLPSADKVKRQTVSARHIKAGLQCGGSDGFSSITANPALGAAMDILVRHGGRAHARAKWAKSSSSASAGGRRSTRWAATCRSTAR
jgi:altronate hydrolase